MRYFLHMLPHFVTVQVTTFQTGMWSKHLSLVWPCHCKNIVEKECSVIDFLFGMYISLHIFVLNWMRTFLFAFYSIPSLLSLSLQQAYASILKYCYITIFMCSMKCLFNLNTSMNIEILCWTCTLLYTVKKCSGFKTE